MAVDKSPPFMVQAIYSFKGKNNDELCFKKTDIITVTQAEEGGWWEGTFKDKTGWFPSNYVVEYKAETNSNNVTHPLSRSSADLLAQQLANRIVIIKDLIDSEKAHVTELENLVNKFLIPISRSSVLSRDEYNGLIGNITEIVVVHDNLLKSLTECSTQTPEQQRIGRLFLTSAVKLKQVHEKYCSLHPKAVLILEKYKEELNKLMEANGAASPGALVLVAGLSKPFRRLDKYDGILQELKRYMEESHVDRGDVSRSISVYKNIATSCSCIRRRKELELQILNGGVQGWEGDELSTLGPILKIGSVAIGPELKDRYLVLFPTTLLILSVSNSLTAFTYEGKLPLTGIQVTKIDQSTDDSYRNAFEIKGPLIEEIVAICQTKDDQQAWVNEINKLIDAAKQNSSPVAYNNFVGGTTTAAAKTVSQSFSPSSMAVAALTSTGGTNAAVPKPPPHAATATGNHQTWSLTRLRPSPPLRCNLSNCTTKQWSGNGKLCDRSFGEDAQILQVIENYCASSKLKYTANSDCR